ncbi:peptidyl-alpha-hydroxyglycine alpha-amidating lyase 2 [Acyrthosiphon pisum]|uniref:peptidylamidoglycolate lyase n=1 Tax=Acyrthosiphon pisum TaxID=7029 RepID=A0A8R2A730_ACYPI|nr:peptidyl-alpha-hydroxyglycine alpha-amidating lyase 2 [Acyrthosiphon pisum]|eukprot:XP_001943881.2 PREDICTED: peptidyl-alpha-hydroxyglycine alpha-amidating lyase 2 [Acyrthosiphon pisum]
MGQPMYLSLLAITVCLITLLATCPTLAVGWPIDSSFYDEIKRVVYGGGENIDDSVAATESSPPPPLSLPSSSQNINRPVEVEGWPRSPIPRLGQVSGVAINTVGQPVIFHRGSRVWDENSFNETFHYQHIEEGPILTNAIVTLSPKTGEVLSSWGAGFFYMPHGITIDHQGNVWVTDVAMHQVFKFSPGAPRASLTFGKRFENGKGYRTLCQPTSVAIASTGDIFIADGYCNSRVLKFTSRGELLRVFPHANEFLSLQVPHSLALLEKHDLICIADREDMRVVCRGAELSTENKEQAPLTIQQPDLGRVYAITNHGDLIYAVNGPTSPLIPVRGFTINPMTENIVDHWTLSKNTAINVPHDIAISKDGSSLYVASISPNRIVKYTMTPVTPLKSD